MFNLFLGSSNDNHISTALSNASSTNKQLITTITTIFDKKIKIYHQLCTKIKQLSSTITTTLSTPFKKHQTKNNHHLQSIYPKYQQDKTSICRFNHQANNALKKILKNLQDSLIHQSNNIINATNKMERKFKDQLTLTLNNIFLQQKQLYQKHKKYQKDYQNTKQLLNKIKLRYNTQWAKLQNLQIQYILSVSQNNTEKESNQKKKLNEIEKIEKEVRILQKNYLEEKDKYQLQVINLEEQIQRFKVKNQQIQLKKVDILKNICNSISLIFVQYANNIIHKTQSQVSCLDLITIQVQQKNIIQYVQDNQLNDKQIQIDNLIEEYSSSYITNLRMRIVSKKAEEIICYGVSKQHKEIIDHCVNPQIEYSKLKKQISKTDGNILRVIQLFQRVFGDKQNHLDQQIKQNQKYSNSNHQLNLISSFIQCMTNDEIARKNFILCLQKFRLIGKFEIAEQKMNIIQKIFNIFLDICRQQSDIYNPKKLMVLSLTYYIFKKKINQNNENIKQKIYIEHYIKNHIIWKNIKWWQGAYLETVFEQYYLKQKILNKINQDQIKNLIQIQQLEQETNKNQKKVSKATFFEEKQIFYNNVCLNQLAYFIKNMHIFGLPINIIKVFAQKYSKNLTLNDKALIQCMIKQAQNQIKI